MDKSLALFLLLSSSLALCETIKLNEGELLSLIESRNGRIASGNSIIQAGEAELGHLRRSFLPKLQLNFGHESTDGTPVNGENNSYAFSTAKASLNLFNGGRDYLQEKVRKSQVLRAESDLESVKFDLLTAARTLFWQMLYQKEVTDIVASALQLNEANLQSARKKIRNNLATQTDEIDFNQTKIQLEQDLLKAKIILVNNMRSMAAILNHPLDTKYDIPDLNAHDSTHALDEFKVRGFTGEKHREIRTLEAQGSAVKYESELNSRWWSPQFDLYGAKNTRFETSQSTNEMDLDQGEVAGVKLTFFFDGLQNRATSVAQSYRVMSFSYLKRQRLFEIQSDYASSYQLYVLNHDLVHSSEENNKLAQKYYESVWSEYLRGIKNSPDVLQAFQRTVESKLRYADIKKDYQVARAEILGFLQE